MKKFKENINSNCSFCNDHPETVVHLFGHCIHIRKLWQDISRFIIEHIYEDVLRCTAWILVLQGPCKVIRIPYNWVNDPLHLPVGSPIGNYFGTNILKTKKYFYTIYPDYSNFLPMKSRKFHWNFVNIIIANQHEVKATCKGFLPLKERRTKMQRG